MGAETYEGSTTVKGFPEPEVSGQTRSGWLRKNWIRAILVVLLMAAVPAYIMLQPKVCHTTTPEPYENREPRQVEFVPAMAMSHDQSCDDQPPPSWWTQRDCAEIVRNNQCWWASTEPHNLCRASCSVCQAFSPTNVCDDNQPPSWWTQNNCQDIIRRGDCWWATEAPHSLCRASCGACSSNAQCTDNSPPAFWTPPYNTCAGILRDNHCGWASLEPHNLCRQTCGRCSSSSCPQASCSKGTESGRVEVSMQPTIYYQEENTLVTHIVRIPAGSANIQIQAHSDLPDHQWAWGNIWTDRDLDLCIRDEVHSHCYSLERPCRNYGNERCSYITDCVAGAMCGRIVGKNGGTGNYNGMSIYYSGDDNLAGTQSKSQGYEAITIMGPTKKDLYVDVSSTKVAEGSVTYSYEGCDGRCTGFPETPRPTPEPTPPPVCDDVPPPAYWQQNTCQDIIATRACQWAAYEPRNICRATCGVCNMPNTNSGGGIQLPTYPQDLPNFPFPVGFLEAQQASESGRRLDASPRRRLLAETCEPKYPVWPGLVAIGLASLLVCTFPSTWCRGGSKSAGGEMANDDSTDEAPPSSSETADEGVLVYERAKTTRGFPPTPKLKELRKLSSSDQLVTKGRQASLPKVRSAHNQNGLRKKKSGIVPKPPPPQRRRGEDKWSF